MTEIQKDWFDKHVTVMTLNDDKETEKKIKKSLKKAFIKEGKKNEI